MHTATQPLPPPTPHLKNPFPFGQEPFTFHQLAFQMQSERKNGSGRRDVARAHMAKFDLGLARGAPHKNSNSQHCQHRGYWKEALTSLLFKGWHGRQLSTMWHTGSFSALKQRPRSLHICGKRQEISPNASSHCSRMFWNYTSWACTRASAQSFASTSSLEMASAPTHLHFIHTISSLA